MTGYEEQDPNDLEHVGVLGMKWGHRKTGTSNQIVRARGNVWAQRNSIRRQESKVSNSSSDKLHGAETVKLNKMKADYLRNPNRIIAARMTTGGKVVTTILFGPIGLGAIAGTSARSRVIENKQDKNMSKLRRP